MIILECSVVFEGIANPAVCVVYFNKLFTGQELALFVPHFQSDNRVQQNITQVLFSTETNCMSYAFFLCTSLNLYIINLYAGNV
jgi:hypothetical protein